jgi:hypothetical protein
MKTSGSQLDQLPIGTMDFAPMLPSGLDVRAVSTSDFGVSATDSGVGRVIIAEVADDAFIGGALREQISVTKGLTGTVMARLTDNDVSNDATVVSGVRGDAIVRFPQDGTTAEGRPPIEQVEWIADRVRFSVVIQLGPDAILNGPTFDASIGRFIDSFAPIAAIDFSLQSAPGVRRGGDKVSS